MAYRWNLIALAVVFVAVALIALRQTERPAEPKVSASTAATPRQTPASQDAGPKELPNLVITDIYYDEPYLRANYMNTGGSRVAADFNISWSSPEKTFDGNHYYRFQVPEPGQERQTGGLTVGLIKAVENQPVTVTVEIDPENRVAESDELDNAKQVTLTPGVPGSNRDRLESASVSASASDDSEAIDLIVVDVELIDEGQIVLAYANQGVQGSTQTVPAEIEKRGSTGTRVDGLAVPEPGEILRFVVSQQDLDFKPTDIVKITLDPDRSLVGERAGNNTFFRQLDRAGDLNGRPAK